MRPACSRGDLFVTTQTGCYYGRRMGFLLKQGLGRFCVTIRRSCDRLLGRALFTPEVRNSSLHSPFTRSGWNSSRCAPSDGFGAEASARPPPYLTPFGCARHPLWDQAGTTNNTRAARRPATRTCGGRRSSRTFRAGECVPALCQTKDVAIIGTFIDQFWSLQLRFSETKVQRTLAKREIQPRVAGFFPTAPAPWSSPTTNVPLYST